ncbi:MAG: hypothetical protein EYR95_02435 [Phormidium sp. SL48-SHIP]|nr:MAG: hypothetical protein EYR95_02435 [Phormidium sp. SL48-SHIP]
MIVSFLDIILILRQWKSRSEAINFLRSSSHASILNDAELENYFYSITVRDALLRDELLTVLVIFDLGYFPVPHIALLPESSKFLIGVDRNIYTVNIRQKISSNMLRLDSPFNSFVYKENLRVMLVFYKIGVLGIKKGKVFLNHSHNIISHVLIEEFRVKLYFENQLSITLGLT